MARPIATRWRWPPESSDGRRSQIGRKRQHLRRHRDAVGDDGGTFNPPASAPAPCCRVTSDAGKAHSSGTPSRSRACAGGTSFTPLPPITILARRCILQPRDGAQQRRLAAAGRADKDDELALGDGQVDVLDDIGRTEGFVLCSQAEAHAVILKLHHFARPDAFIRRKADGERRHRIFHVPRQVDVFGNGPGHIGLLARRTAPDAPARPGNPRSGPSRPPDARGSHRPWYGSRRSHCRAHPPTRCRPPRWD